MDTLEDLIRDSMRLHAADAPNPSSLSAGVAGRELVHLRRLQGTGVAAAVAVLVAVPLCAGLTGGEQRQVAPSVNKAGETAFPQGTAGGTSAATGLPGSDVVKALSPPVTVTRIGSAAVAIGIAPSSADHIEIQLRCLSKGTFTVADGASMTCSAADAAAGTGVMTYALAVKPGQDSTTVRTAAGSRWRLTASYARVTTSPWGVNRAGQTYGVSNAQGSPTLVAVIASNGKAGYVYERDLSRPTPANPSQAMAGQNSATAQADVPVYTSDGKTVIGVFVMQGGSGDATGSLSSGVPVTLSAVPGRTASPGGASVPSGATPLPTLSASAVHRLQTAPFFYSREIDASGSGQYAHKQWLGHDARGRVVDRSGAGSVPPYGTSGSMFALQLTWEQLSSVTDLALVRKADTLPETAPESAKGRSEQEFRFAPLDGPESPAFVATMFTVLRDLPGVAETANVSDAAGRAGVALEQKDFRYIFSPDHGRLLERDVLPVGGCSTHAPWSRQLFLESGPVDNTTETVPAETLPHQPSASHCPEG